MDSPVCHRRVIPLERIEQGNGNYFPSLLVRHLIAEEKVAGASSSNGCRPLRICYLLEPPSAANGACAAQIPSASATIHQADPGRSGLGRICRIDSPSDQPSHGARRRDPSRRKRRGARKQRGKLRIGVELDVGVHDLPLRLRLGGHGGSSFGRALYSERECPPKPTTASPLGDPRARPPPPSGELVEPRQCGHGPSFDKLRTAAQSVADVRGLRCDLLALGFAHLALELLAALG